MNTIKLICIRCKYTWTYKGDKIRIAKKYPQYAKCPHCTTSVKIPNNEPKT